MNARVCICPGSYDPVTVGHLNVFERAATLFDEVIVAVLGNPEKKGTFSHQERVDLINASTAHLPGVRAKAYGDRLIVDVCREEDAGAILKGIRTSTDYEYELPMALMNREMTGIETLLLPADPKYIHYSSSLIRLIAGYGADISAMVPAPVLNPLLERLGRL